MNIREAIKMLTELDKKGETDVLMDSVSRIDMEHTLDTKISKEQWLEGVKALNEQMNGNDELVETTIANIVRVDREITFHSVWGDGSHIVSNVVEYNAETGEIQADVIQLDYDPDGGLEEEYIEITNTIDGTVTRNPVCMRCHAHVLKTIMVDDNVGSDIHEELECPECGAE